MTVERQDQSGKRILPPIRSFIRLSFPITFQVFLSCMQYSEDATHWPIRRSIRSTRTIDLKTVHGIIPLTDEGSLCLDPWTVNNSPAVIRFRSRESGVRLTITEIDTAAKSDDDTYLHSGKDRCCCDSLHTTTARSVHVFYNGRTTFWGYSEPCLHALFNFM